MRGDMLAYLHVNVVKYYNTWHILVSSIGHQNGKRPKKHPEWVHQCSKSKSSNIKDLSKSIPDIQSLYFSKHWPLRDFLQQSLWLTILFWAMMKTGRRLKSSWRQSVPTVLKCQKLLRQKIASPAVKKACCNQAVLTLLCLMARMDFACPVPHRHCESIDGPLTLC